MVKTMTVVVVLMAVLYPHVANSYVLITADLDDVHAIARQIAQSPVSQQLTDVIRRASAMFNRHISQQRRTRRGDDIVEGTQSRDHRFSNEQNSRGEAIGDDDVVALAKNASAYLSSMKQFFEKINK